MSKWVYAYNGIPNSEEKEAITGWLPGCPVVRDLPYNTGDVSSIPVQGTETPHTAEQLSSGTTQ